MQIKPILPILLKSNSLDGGLLTDNLFHKNGYTSIVKRWRGLKKGIQDVRKICGLKLCGENQFIDLYNIVHRSQFEMRIYNFLYKAGAEVKGPDNLYPKDFIDSTGLRCLDDGEFYSLIKKKNTYRSMGDNKNKGNKRTNSERYKNKKLKQDYWKKNPGKCIQIMWENNLEKLEINLQKLFKPHFGKKCKDGTFEDIKLKKLSLNELKKCWDYNKENKILKFLKDSIQEKMVKKHLYYIMNYQKNKSAIDNLGGIKKLYNKIGISDEVYKKKSEEKRKEKWRKTINNKTPEEKKILVKK